MSIQTDLSSAPYYDDFDAAKNYYKILFRPGVAVQTRELNQLQTLLQNQIERFGDNIFRQGTIIDGCEITFHSNIPYVKIRDLEADGSRASVYNYLNAHVRNSSNLVGQIIEVSSGFEAREDKNTLFVKYLNSGDDLNTYAFSADDILTIYNPDYPVNKINVINGSLGFSNTDTVVVSPAIVIQNTTGGSDFTALPDVGDIITNTLLANAEIVSVDTTASSTAVILRVKPLDTDLASPSSNSQWWTFNVNDTFVANSGAAGVITEIIGGGAEATVLTSGSGAVTSIDMTSQGSGYTVGPTVYIKSTSATSGQIASLDLTPQTFIGRTIVMDATTTPIGMGYGVTVNGGVIYQKGYFIKVEPQLLIVNSYSNQPNNVVVGFRTNEAIINSNIDTSLLDNSLGTPNSTAPGADRLNLESQLVVENKTAVQDDPEFLSIIEFSDGEPFIQRKQTQYNIITNEIAKRTFEESGNYVLDPFYVTTRSEGTFAAEANTFLLTIDPGIAYINGRRVETTRDYYTSVPKGTNTAANDVVVSLSYGNYIRVKEVGGLFKFNTGDTISLHSAARNHVSLHVGEVPDAVSAEIGKARIRSFVFESGVPGTPEAVYRLYLFDIDMVTGKSFSDVRCVHWSSDTTAAVADIVTTADPSTGRALCQLYDSSLNSQVQSAGVNAIKNINNGSYIYRTVDETLTTNTAGYAVFNLSEGSFPYVGQLTTFQEKEVIVIPKEDGYASFNLLGSFTVSSTNTSMSGVATSFLTELQVGDWIMVSNNGGALATTVQIASIANNTSATITANASANVSGSSTGTLVFPRYVPIPFDRSTRSITVSANQTQLTANLGMPLATDMDVSIVYNVKSEPTPVAKTVLRDRFVRIKAANNVATTEGPWSLGVSDVIRLKKVYVANGASNTLSVNAMSSGVDSTNDFIQYNNHRFSNGDAVLYVGGTYTIPGLSNNTTYWIYSANSSGFKLTSSNTSPLAINAIATNDINHTFTGTPLYFGPNSIGVEDITDDFYIDQNQNENYYDTSYLYPTPDPIRGVQVNDVLLVQFDVLSHTSSGGMKHIGSYTVNDGLTLNNSGSTINTVEIPSFYTTTGKYYDLRDSVDFRPTVTTTANTAANTTTTWSVNPAIPTFSQRFGSTELYFPAPESSFTGNVEYYLGRIDRVIITANGSFDVIRGTSSLRPQAPAEPQNTISLNLISIPPYPSYPAFLSPNSLDFADMKIANENYTVKRQIDYSISSLFKNSDIVQEQPRVYTMSDIGNLDRRISDLETYVALTQNERKVRDRTIPSTIDTSLERFKYGFFVDSFQDSTYAELSHPEYNASVINGELVPRYDEFRLDFRFNTSNNAINALSNNGRYLTLPYVEHSLIFQSLATQDPPPPPPPAPPGSPPPPPAPIVKEQKVIIVDLNHRSTEYSANGTAYEDWAFTMSNTAGTCELFMNCRGNDTAVVVYQSPTLPVLKTVSMTGETTGPITTSSQFATPNLAGTPDVLPGGKAYLVGGKSEWENDTGFRTSGPSQAGGKWVDSSYKMKWAHNPSLGRYYIIRVYKGGHLVSPNANEPRGTYVFRLYYPADEEQTTTPVPVTSVVKPPVKLQHIGLMQSTNIGYDTKYYRWYSRYTNEILTKDDIIKLFGSEIPEYQRMYGYTLLYKVPKYASLKAISLKPDTKYKVYIQGRDETARCTAQLSRLEDYSPEVSSTLVNSLTYNGRDMGNLITDMNGVLNFDLDLTGLVKDSLTDQRDINSAWDQGTRLTTGVLAPRYFDAAFTGEIYIVSSDIAPATISAAGMGAIPTLGAAAWASMVLKN